MSFRDALKKHRYHDEITVTWEGFRFGLGRAAASNPQFKAASFEYLTTLATYADMPDDLRIQKRHELEVRMFCKSTLRWWTFTDDDGNHLPESEAFDLFLERKPEYKGGAELFAFLNNTPLERFRIKDAEPEPPAPVEPETKPVETDLKDTEQAAKNSRRSRKSSQRSATA